MKRLFDIALASALVVGISWFVVLIVLMIFSTSKGPIFYWSKRVGQDNKTFLMPKFRTMQIQTPEVATHLLEKPENWLTPFGAFLRQTSLDELPQLISIIKGDMSFVGPRPALYNQHDLIELRTKNNIQKIKPGLTGWAQINGRDQISIEQKVAFDREYMIRQSIYFDLSILIKTFWKISGDKNVSH